MTATPRDLLLCPVCHGTDFAELCPDEPGGPLGAAACTGCGLGLERQLSADPFGYARAAYDRARERGAGTPAWARYHHDSAVAAARFRQLAGVLPAQPGRWLDVGCGTGAFLAHARRLGWRVCGVEADAAFCQEVGRATGITVLPQEAWLQAYWRQLQQPGPAAGEWHCVSFFDVLEHVLDLQAFFQAAVAALAPGGLLVVEAPDRDAAAPGEFAAWRHRKVTAEFTEHVWHFNESSLRRLAGRYAPAGEVVACQRPLPGRLQFVWRKQTPPAAPARPA